MALFPVETERLVIRCLRPEDAAAVESYANDRDISQQTCNIPYPYPKGLAISWIAESVETMRGGRTYALAVAERPSDRLVGCIDLRIPDFAKGGEIGYWIGRPFWGRGLATEAVRRLVVLGFNRVGLHRVFGSVRVENRASARVLEKLGFTAEAEQDQEFPAHRCCHRVTVYGLNRADAREDRLRASILGGLHVS